MVYHPNEFETAVTLDQNEPLYCNVPDSLSESLARARLVQYIHNSHFPLCSKNEHYHIHAINFTLWSKQLHALDNLFVEGGGGVQGNDSLSRENWS